MTTSPATQAIIEEAAQGVMGVLTALLAMNSSQGPEVVKFFLDQVPERGEALWTRFKQSGQTGFNAFFEGIIRQNMAKAMYPKDCTLDSGTRTALVSLVSTAVMTAGAKTNADALGPYTGTGRFYDAARQVSCKGCSMNKCRHYIRGGVR